MNIYFVHLYKPIYKLNYYSLYITISYYYFYVALAILLSISFGFNFTVLSN